MSIYDLVGAKYDDWRGAVGLKTMRELVERIAPGPRILELGCGTGHPIAAGIAPLAGRYLGIDNSRAMLAAFESQVPEAEARLLDMTEVEKAGTGWDLIFSWGAVCHLPEEPQARALSAAAGLLRPGGRLLFTSGEKEGRASGKVGPHTVQHYSLGQDKYCELLRGQGLRFISAEYGEGDFYVYLFLKPPENP